MTFGDVSVEDSRYLTTSNARKVIRLAQCQVEYLLHVQETLAAHKERLRGVAEQAQRDGIEARADAQEPAQTTRRGARVGVSSAPRSASSRLHSLLAEPAVVSLLCAPRRRRTSPWWLRRWRTRTSRSSGLQRCGIVFGSA